jgi:MOSC domain-containing protein YiiM
MLSLVTLPLAAELETHLEHLRSAPRDEGTLRLLVRRPRPRAREVLEAGVLDVDLGLVGDSWSTRRSRWAPDRPPDRDKQVTVMSHRMVSLLADDPAGQALAGDQLFVDLDVSVANLPAGSRLAVGGTVIEVSGKPHLGCAKFERAYGAEAVRFVNSEAGRELRLRGLNGRVVVGGEVRPGDTVRKL